MLVHSRSLADTEAIAAVVASALEIGDLVALDGELGGGKTAFVRAAAGALGATDDVTSPTFTIVQQYAGRLPITHVDAYRLRGPDDTDDLALDELQERSVMFVEWADVIDGALPEDRLSLQFAPGAGEDARRITITPTGPAWVSRLAALTDALAAYSDGGEA